MLELPVDILADIFIRVPAEPLFQSRRVCKAWRDIIDDPAFCRLHVRHHRGSRLEEDDQLIVNGKYKLPLESLANCIEENPTKSISSWIKAKYMPALEHLPLFGPKSAASCLKASLDGLDLLSYLCTMRLALYNPLTCEFLELPLLHDSHNTFAYQYLWYAGLVYDSATDDYKVVRLSAIRDGLGEYCKLKTMVYSLKSNSWRRIVDIPRPHAPRYNSLVTYNGKLYWLDSDEDKLVVLNLSTETYALLLLPPKQPQARLLGLAWQFKVMSGCLLLSYFSKEACMDGWILNCCGAGKNPWTKLFTFSEFSRPRIPVTDLYLEPQAYLKKKGLVLIRYGRGEYIWLDTEKNTSRKVKIEGLNTISRRSFQSSIICLNEGDRLDGFRIIPGTRKRKSDLELPVKVVDYF